MSKTSITVQELGAMLKDGKPIDLIDVRTPGEFQEIHVSVAKNVPLDRLSPEALGADRDTSRPLYVICRSGARGSQACAKLLQSGIGNVINVEGGTMAWDKAGLPVVRGKGVMSLDRQVRIAAGLLAFCGAVLALTLDRRWALLSGVVGLGLMHAGITNSCMMGMLLARMPWNQVKASAGT
jgi:rhodanese-related sulfurtransferase